MIITMGSPITNSEEKDLPITTRSKGPTDTLSKVQKVTNDSSAEKDTPKKTSNQTTGPSSSSVKKTSSTLHSSKTLIVSDNIVEYMKKTKANISLYEGDKLKQKHKLVLNIMNAVPTSSLPSTIFTTKAFKSKTKSKPPTTSLNKVNPTHVILISDRSNSHTPYFLLNFEVFNKNVHNCFVDSSAS